MEITYNGKNTVFNSGLHFRRMLGSYACDIFHLANDAGDFCAVQQCPEDGRFKQWLSLRSSFHQNVGSHSRLRPSSEMRNVIRKELFQPGTALVSPAEIFDTDWKIFEDESRFMNVRSATVSCTPYTFQG